MKYSGTIIFALTLALPGQAGAFDDWQALCKSETARNAVRKQLEGRNVEIFDYEAASRCPRIDLPETPVHDSADPSVEQSHTDWIYEAHYSADGKTMLSASRDGSLGLWDVGTGKLIRRIYMPAGIVPKGQPNTTFVRSAAFVGDGTTIAGGKDTLPVQLYNTATGEPIGNVAFEVAQDSFFPPKMATTSTGLLLLAGDRDSVAAIDVASKAVRYKLPGHGKKATAVAVSEAADLVSTAAKGDEELPNSAPDRAPDIAQHVFLWRLSTGEKVANFTVPSSSEPDGLSFSKNGSQLAIITGGKVHIYSVKDKRVTQTIVVHPMFSVFDVAFTHDGKGLITCQSHPALWDLATGKIVRHFGPFNDLCHSVEVSPDGKYAVTTSMASDLKIWEIATGTFERRLGIDVKPPR